LDAEINEQWDSEIESSDGADSELDSSLDGALCDGLEHGTMHNIEGPGLRKRSSYTTTAPDMVIEPMKKRFKEVVAAAADRTAAAPLRPPNFSRVDPALSLRELVAEFPLFAEAQSRGLSVVVRAGEMLFVPAGW